MHVPARGWCLAAFCLAFALPLLRAEDRPADQNDSKRAPMHELLRDSLDAAHRGDLDALEEKQKALSSVNETIFRVYRLDVQGGIRRAAANKNLAALARIVTGQTLLATSLLLQESRGLTDKNARYARLWQALLNYRVVEQELRNVDPAKADKVGSAFKRLQASMSGNLQDSVPVIQEIETLLLPKKAAADQ